MVFVVHFEYTGSFCKGKINIDKHLKIIEIKNGLRE